MGNIYLIGIAFLNLSLSACIRTWSYGYNINVTVSLYICYLDDRSINIKHYTCYGYSSNILIKILIPQNKKEMFSDFTYCAMLLGLLTIIWRTALGHTGPWTSRIVQWKILHLFPIPRLRWILPAPIVVRRSPCLAAFSAYISCAVVQKRWYPKRNQ